MSQEQILIAILGMSVVTYVPRLLPVWALASRSLPQLLVDWLNYVPVAVLAAMLLPSLLLVENKVHLGWDNLFLLAALPTGWVVYKFRSLFAAVMVGMLIVAMARLLF